MTASLLAFMSLLLVFSLIGIISYTKDIIKKNTNDTTPNIIKNFCFGVCLTLVLITSIVITLVYQYTYQKEQQELVIK